MNGQGIIADEWELRVASDGGAWELRHRRWEDGKVSECFCTRRAINTTAKK
jgi:hypothetical protein